MAPINKAIAVIAGVGPGTGASVARKFAKAYPVVLLSRSSTSHGPVAEEINSNGGSALGISTDLTDSNSVSAAFEQIEQKFPGAAIAAAVFNFGGRLVRKPFLEITEEEFEQGFASQGKAGYLFSRATLPLLLKAVGLEFPPTLIFTGATASLKGSAYFSSFASGKFAVRALSQSLAREFSPQGIHVSHAVIDGVIDIPRTEHIKFDQPDAKLSPHAIADAYWFLHTQPKTAFAYELDLRPSVEKW